MNNLIVSSPFTSQIPKYSFHAEDRVSAVDLLRNEYAQRTDIDHAWAWLSGIPLTSETSSLLSVLNRCGDSVLVDPVISDLYLNSSIGYYPEDDHTDQHPSKIFSNFGIRVRNDRNSEVTKPNYLQCNKLGIRYPDSAYYSAIVQVMYLDHRGDPVTSQDRFDPTTSKLLYWVSSPHIMRDRAVPASKGMSLNSKLRKSTAVFSKAKDAVAFALKIPRITTTSLVLGQGSEDRAECAYESMNSDSQRLLQAAKDTLRDMISDVTSTSSSVSALDFMREMLTVSQKVAQGVPVTETDIPTLLSRINAFAESTEIMRDNVDFASKHVPVHVVRAGGDPNIHCYLLTDRGKVIDQQSYHHVGDLPIPIAERLHTLELNKDNFSSIHWNMQGISGVGGVLKSNIYEYAVVFVPNECVGTVFA